MSFQSCSVCASPEHQAINQALGNRVPLLKLQSLYHISKSSLSRHSRKCLHRTRENKYSGRRIPVRECKLFTWWDESCPAEFRNQIPDYVLRRDDYIILRVCYEKPFFDEQGRIRRPESARDAAIFEKKQRDDAAAKSSAAQPEASPETAPLGIVGQE